MKAFSRYVFCIVAVMCACCEGAPLFAGGFSTPYWYGVGERMFAGSSFLGSRNAFGKSGATESDKPLVASQAEFYAVKSAYENGDADAMAMLERYIAESVEKVGIPSANSMLADLYMKAGRFADAAKIYASADISTLSREERALMTLNSAIIEYEKGNFGEVKALLSDFPKPGVPYGNEALFYKSAACYALGEYDEAEQGFDRLSHDGRFADASRHYLTGRIRPDARNCSAFAASRRFIWATGKSACRISRRMSVKPLPLCPRLFTCWAFRIIPMPVTAMRFQCSEGWRATMRS